MRFPLFVDAVARRAELRPEQAAAISRAVLRTVAERVRAGEADDLAAQFPDDLSAYLTGPADAGRPDTFGPLEFLRRVAERAGVEPATAQVGVRAVFATLRETVTVGEFQDLVAQLPESFTRGVDRSPPRRYDE
ncbi:DUF2267 domain-containing protein [Micromonospora halophytica]|uniref:Uncharacterized conserved protein, DUF2267 family n=1 Tax=Micromonospora halophytica TaxID=47864 RepID=A0A1C5HUQ5_9ACTN|nr:DUF2267 domain-containing protein [Micromonospora halophytica]SCG49754.1 Uncharacterized conserved protein, DUF2267 family [Micromonospora halophytica]